MRNFSISLTNASLLLCSLISLAGNPAYTLSPFNDFVMPDFAATIDLSPIFKCGATPTCPAKVQKLPTSELPAIAKPAVNRHPLPILTL